MNYSFFFFKYLVIYVHAYGEQKIMKIMKMRKWVHHTQEMTANDMEQCGQKWASWTGIGQCRMKKVTYDSDHRPYTKTVVRLKKNRIIIRRNFVSIHSKLFAINYGPILDQMGWEKRWSHFEIKSKACIPRWYLSLLINFRTQIYILRN